jgi:hypothetical protein
VNTQTCIYIPTCRNVYEGVNTGNWTLTYKILGLNGGYHENTCLLKYNAVYEGRHFPKDHLCTLKTDHVGSSEMSVGFFQIKRCRSSGCFNN